MTIEPESAYDGAVCALPGCTRPITGPSLYYCSPEHQDAWNARQLQPQPADGADRADAAVELARHTCGPLTAWQERAIRGLYKTGTSTGTAGTRYTLPPPGYHQPTHDTTAWDTHPRPPGQPSALDTLTTTPAHEPAPTRLARILAVLGRRLTCRHDVHIGTIRRTCTRSRWHHGRHQDHDGWTWGTQTTETRP